MDERFLVLFFKKEQLKKALLLKKKQNFFYHLSLLGLAVWLCAASPVPDPGADLQPILPLIGRLAMFPSETLLAIPARPSEALRGALVLRGLTRQIGRDALAAQAREEAASETRPRQAVLAPGGMSEPREQLTTPVEGIVIHAFGEAGDTGAATGMTYAATPGARVSSPCGGKVVFAGPFRSFGLLLIVDCGGGYHFVLAGFDRLDVAVGRRVQTGDPVGVMPKNPPHGPGERPTLYVELRHDGTPVNPSPWLRPRS